MSKNMAVVSSGVVTNIISTADWAREDEHWKELGGRGVAIGDTYESGKFYRDGVELLTPLQEMEAERDGLLSDLAELIAEVYAEDDGVIEE